MIPPFDERGNLPPGIHRADWDEVEARLGGTPWRNFLLLGLREALDSLQGAKCRTVYIDGSFASATAAPADFDACWDPRGVDFDALDPSLRDFSENRRAQKTRFSGELFPADMAADSTGTPFFDYFQRTTDHRTKGILEIDLGVER